MTEVAAVRDMIHAFSEMDERHGGHHGRSALVTYLPRRRRPAVPGPFPQRRRPPADALRRQPRRAPAGLEKLRRRPTRSRPALLPPVLCPGHRIRPARARQFVMRTMAMQGLKLHRPEHCLGLAETGLNRAKGRVDAQTEALFRVVYAHTLAKSGKHRAALAEADHARTLLTGAPGDEMPFWALSWGPPAASVYSRTAKVHETVGTTAPPPSNTRWPPPRARQTPTRGSSPWIWSRRRRCTSSAAASSRRASRGTRPSITWAVSAPPAPPQGGLPHAQRPQKVQGPGPAVRGRARRTRTGLPRRRMTQPCSKKRRTIGAR